MPAPQEPDFPPGHPARCDYVPDSPEAKEWARKNISLKGERDHPHGHPKAVDTPGNQNHVPVRAGIDPEHPELEEFSGRTPAQAAAVRRLYQEQAKGAKDTPEVLPTIALDPPAQRGVARAEVLADGAGLKVYCPGCQAPHIYDGRWQFNGSLELPSFTPSMAIDRGSGGARCHSFVTNGRIQFLPDSTHRLSGQTVDLPPVAAAQETINA